MEINKSRANIFLETPLEDLVGKKTCFTLGCINFSWCRRKVLVTYHITGRVEIYCNRTKIENKAIG